MGKKSNNFEDKSNKCIEEMAYDISDILDEVQDNCNCIDCMDCKYDPYGIVGCKSIAISNLLYRAGYRKERQGEWIDTGDEQLDTIYSGYKCSVCGFVICGHSGKYCSECGARMKGR